MKKEENENVNASGTAQTDMPRRRKVKSCIAADMTERMRFNADIETRSLISLYLIYSDGKVSRDEFFHDVVHEYVKRHNPELYAKQKELTGILGK